MDWIKIVESLSESLGAGIEDNTGISFSRDGTVVSLRSMAMGANTGEQEDSCSFYYQADHLDYLTCPWWAEALKLVNPLFADKNRHQLRDPRLKQFYGEPLTESMYADLYWVALMPPTIDKLVKLDLAAIVAEVSSELLPFQQNRAKFLHLLKLRSCASVYLGKRLAPDFGVNDQMVLLPEKLPTDYQMVASKLSSLLPELREYLLKLPVAC